MEKACVIAFSGGLDSSIAALLLRERFPLLVAATHFIWPGSRCCNIEVFKRAAYLAESLSLPYYVIDLSQAFKAAVVEDFINSYINGFTPNPCVLCNEKIRFSLFYEEVRKKLLAEKLIQERTELFFATGHYVRLVQRNEGLFLAKAKDPKKDQSYMLYRLKTQILKHLVFPLGDFLKTEVRELAYKHNLSVAEVAESQDACFVDTNYVDFIINYSKKTDLVKRGKIIDLKGNFLGEHKGFIYYTIGQRRGLGLGNGPWYVVKIEPEENLLVVARDDYGADEFSVFKTNWFIDPPYAGIECKVKIRYQASEIPAFLIAIEDEKAEVKIAFPQLVTPGQSAVFYQDDLVIGGGIITRSC